jgi:signal transduction histidine kinase
LVLLPQRFSDSIQGRLILLLAAILVPVLALQAWVHYNRLHSQQDQEVEANLEIAYAMGEAFDGFVQDVLRQELAIGMSFALFHPLPEKEIGHFLDKGKAEWAGSLDIHWVTPRGRVQGSTNPEEIGRDLSGLSYFGQILAGREWVISDLAPSDGSKGAHFAIARRINDRGTTSPLGILVAEVSPEHLDRILGLERDGGRAITFLDTRGRVVYRFPARKWTWEERDWQRKYPFIRDGLEGSDIKDILAGHDGKERILAVTKLDFTGWLAGADRPEEEVMGPIVSGMLLDICLLFFFGGLAFLAALAISRTITVPVKKLRDHAVCLGQGEAHLMGKMSGPRELRDLAGAFDVMAEEIRIREDALRKAQSDLEVRVRERTAKLAEACEALKGEIGERQIAEDALRQSESMLQTVFNGISEPLIMLDKDLGVRMLNDASRKYFQVNDRAKAVGGSCHDLSGGGCAPCEKCTIPALVSRGDAAAFERKGALDADRIEQVVIYPLEAMNGGARGAIIRISDITEKRKLEKHLIRADRLSSLGQLSGGIAHEIRNPLSGINLYVDILGDEERFTRTEQELNILSEIKGNIHRINGIIKRVLDFARQSDSPVAGIDMNSLIQESLRLWHSKMKNNGIVLHLSLEENLPIVLGDAIGLQQIINNLVQNAIEAMTDGGSLEIATASGVLSLAQDRPAIHVSVKDNGQGIAPEQQKNIFNPFFTTKHTGNGLGLSISHQIVARHGGILSFESAPGKGTTFTVELPAAPKE